VSLDINELEAAGVALGEALPAASVVWLRGPLGAGKTTLVRAIARGRGVATAATSPTFGLVHHYEGTRGAIYHVDCYRIRKAEEAADFDWQTLASADMVLIEWPERAGAWALPASVTLTLDYAADDRRTLVRS
jgi:tRNA threonylcarbamoyladenosine biosynthesis protein TsaE